MEDIQSWWEVPSIVHFCDVFSPFCKDLCRVNINEFEHAVENNSYLLTDMAMRFIKICGFYDPDTNEWWNEMKKLLKNNKTSHEYNFENSLDSVICFDHLARKQKVVALYILCHFIMDVGHIQKQISNKQNVWCRANVKPLGYDSKKSIYWYFGTTKLYREDFENTTDLSIYSSMLNDFNDPYPSGVFGTGKWSIVCDDADSWDLFASNIEYSNNKSIQYLHKSVCNIICNLPKVRNKKKVLYKYFKFNLPLRRSTRRLSRTLNTATNNKTRDLSYTAKFTKNKNTVKDSSTSPKLEKMRQDCLEREVRVNLVCFDY